jgi:hypothetical protein
MEVGNTVASGHAFDRNMKPMLRSRRVQARMGQHEAGQPRGSKHGLARRASGLRVDGDFDDHAWFNTDAGDLLDNVSGRSEIDETLVNAHLETIPGIGPLTARRLASGDLESFRGHADRPLDLEVFILGAADEVGTYFLQGLDVSRREGNANLLVVRYAIIRRLLHWSRHGV